MLAGSQVCFDTMRQSDERRRGFGARLVRDDADEMHAFAECNALGVHQALIADVDCICVFGLAVLEDRLRAIWSAHRIDIDNGFELALVFVVGG
jgi:hypothetical protein